MPITYPTLPSDSPETEGYRHEDLAAEESFAEEEYQFTPKLSPKWALNLEQVLTVAFFGALFVLLNSLSLRSTDIWSHVMYGQWILEHGEFPQNDPWMPLAAGMEVIHTAWLSQLIFAGVESVFGTEALSHLFAVVMVATYLLWARLFYWQTGRVWLAVVCTVLLITVGWSRLATIRPENFAALCFAVIFLLAARAPGFGLLDDHQLAVCPRLKWPVWLGVPITFALWANLHGSFIIGLVVLACYLAGRIVEVIWRTRDYRAVLADVISRRWLYLLELSAAATLLNPYGLDLWLHTLGFSSHPNLAFIDEWKSLELLGVGGRTFAFSIVLLIFVWRQSQRAIRPHEVLLLAVFGFAALGGIRMLGWYAPIYVVVIAPHVANIARRWLPARLTQKVQHEQLAAAEAEYVLPPGHSFRYSIVALLLIWIAFALSPSSQIVFNKQRQPEVLHSVNTPLRLTEHLHLAYAADAPSDIALPGGQTFHPQPWGDWLKWAGPAELRPFVTSHVHLVPPEVYRDYLRIITMQHGWESTLNRYNVTTMIVDRREQSAMYRTLNRSNLWTLRYADDQAAVFVRDSRAAASRAGEDRTEVGRTTTRRIATATGEPT